MPASPRRRNPGPRPLPRRKKPVNHHIRVVVVRFLLIAALVAAGLKLIQVQGFEAEALAAKAERQRITTMDLPAKRGSIVDRNGTQLAFSVESRALAFRPDAMREDIATFNENLDGDGKPLDFNTETAAIAKGIAGRTGADEKELLAVLRSDRPFVYLVDDVEPGVARAIQEEFPSVISEYRAEREYPGKTTAANIIGVANWRTEDPDVKKHDLHGLAGLELLRDNQLAGTPGSQRVATKEGDDVIIPGTEQDLRPAVDGSSLELTIDADLQYFLQQALTDYVTRAQARSGSAVVMDAKTGEVYALANDRTFDPSQSGWDDPASMGNPAVSTPYEPGSVNKIITAMCAIDQNITSPLDVHQVRGSIRVADRTIDDAWPHGTLPLTTTGIFAKSSNVGTLMLAQECGQDRFSDLMKKLGLGTRTGVGLSGESPGQVPPRNQWSGSTFGNLPIGQGLLMTVLQMAGMYQTVANDGVRVPPRIVAATITPDGERIQEPRPEPVRVVDAKTAKTVRDMFRAIVQKAPVPNNGTGVAAALPGYQIAGKTGTAQQVKDDGSGYSQENYWITFAGILPADSPRFVVGIVIDRPKYVGGPPEGKNAAPLFHDIASYLAQKFTIPLSTEQSPVVPLVEP